MSARTPNKDELAGLGKAIISIIPLCGDPHFKAEDYWWCKPHTGIVDALLPHFTGPLLSYLTGEQSVDDQVFPQARRFVEGRKKGQAAGAQANRAKAEKRSNVIVSLARDLWEQKPELINNMLATSREIERKKDPALKLGPFNYLGADAIRKHLRTLKTKGRI